MKTLIVFASKYGATAECAKRIAALLPGETVLHRLDEGECPAPEEFDGVICGTSIYMGQPRKEMKRFLKTHAAALQKQPLGLFLCCIQDVNRSVAEQVDVSFPRALREHACVLGALGGVVEFDRLRGLDRFMMNLISGDLRKKTGASAVNTLSGERIAKFAQTYLQGAQK